EKPTEGLVCQLRRLSDVRPLGERALHGPHLCQPFAVAFRSRGGRRCPSSGQRPARAVCELALLAPLGRREEKRRGRDSNPRRTFQHVRDFQSRSLGHSDTSPCCEAEKEGFEPSMEVFPPITP